jgi:hypothetical protein
MEAVGQLSGGIAHDSPMAPVGSTELNEVLNVLRSLLLETAMPLSSAAVRQGFRRIDLRGARPDL